MLVIYSEYIQIKCNEKLNVRSGAHLRGPVISTKSSLCPADDNLDSLTSQNPRCSFPAMTNSGAARLVQAIARGMFSVNLTQLFNTATLFILFQFRENCTIFLVVLTRTFQPVSVVYSHYIVPYLLSLCYVGYITLTISDILLTS